MMGSIARGCAAGAVGTTALDAVTCADMALRGRSAGTIPAALVDEIGATIGRPVAGDAGRDNRLSGLGALSGIPAGTPTGALGSPARGVGIRPPAWGGGLLAGAPAMAAADLPPACLGIGDPRTGSARDSAAEAIPHLIHGLTTCGVLDPRERGR
ncbi:hypothetical protein [Streptomyces sp. AA1529]|uniref:hypothetical protein n=1 Tax=Streptomyces sp. AA1529 TaxID=1203257 RepID=UPI000306B031|nr:hypothetical protein [Streptomyces sp. AA1529]